jgi:hypothetical protein
MNQPGEAHARDVARVGEDALKVPEDKRCQANRLRGVAFSCWCRCPPSSPQPPAAQGSIWSAPYYIQSPATDQMALVASGKWSVRKPPPFSRSKVPVKPHLRVSSIAGEQFQCAPGSGLAAGCAVLLAATRPCFAADEGHRRHKPRRQLWKIQVCWLPARTRKAGRSNAGSWQLQATHSSPGSGPRLHSSTHSRSPGWAGAPSASVTRMGPLR